MSELIKLTDKANPKPAHLERIRKRLDENDWLVKANESGSRAFKDVINTYSESALVRELFDRQIDAKRKELDYESENVMVRMMIDHVILCHIRLTTFEALHARVTKDSLSLAVGMYWDKVLSSYQRRFQRACESSAKVKKLLCEAELRSRPARSIGTKRPTAQFTAELNDSQAR